MGGLLGGGGGGGGGQRICWPPLSNYWGGAWPPLAPLFLRLWSYKSTKTYGDWHKSVASAMHILNWTFLRKICLLSSCDVCPFCKPTFKLYVNINYHKTIYLFTYTFILSLFQFEAERLATIERDNRILLEKMAYVMRTSGMVDHIKHDYAHKR